MNWTTSTSNINLQKVHLQRTSNLYLRRIEHVMDCCWVSCSFRTKYILPVIIRDMYCPPIDCLLVHIFSCQLRKRALCVCVTKPNIWTIPISRLFSKFVRDSFWDFLVQICQDQIQDFFATESKKNCNQMFSCTIKELTSFGGWRTRAEEGGEGGGGVFFLPFVHANVFLGPPFYVKIAQICGSCGLLGSGGHHVSGGSLGLVGSVGLENVEYAQFTWSIFLRQRFWWRTWQIHNMSNFESKDGGWRKVSKNPQISVESRSDQISVDWEPAKRDHLLTLVFS